MAIDVALLWHMHQPMYVDPTTGEAILPWVRLHATHAYYDMARMLERHPRARVTVNFVPSLVEQLEAAAAGTSRERYLELTRTPAEALGADERRFVLRQFFMADRERSVRPFPRYQELLDRRGEDPARIDASRFSSGDLRDLQLLFNLTWMGFAARRDEPEVARLVEKGRDFTEEDKRALLAAQQRLVERIVPLWRKLSEAGQVELSTTPYFHPILPLVCDSDSARRAMPQATLPPRFVHPEDAREQVGLALAKHEAAFGRRPLGMWPAEGSVSPEALAIVAAQGLRWVATDEGILQRSSPAPTVRGELYRPYSYDAGGRSLALAFRDRALSDRIGFTYARLPVPEAVADVLSLVRRAEADGQRAGVERPLLAVVLDGENAWEHYEGHGEAFLDAFYAALEDDPAIHTSTMSDALAGPAVALAKIHSGSWIESTFRIWIGHPEENLGWELLGQVRELVARHEKAQDVAPERLAEAKRLLLSAEGSDWFWWYGDDFETDNAAEFDLLFRDRLGRAAELVAEPPPARLAEPLSARARRQASRRSPVTPPTALVHPALDGNATFSDWLGAGRLLPETGHGAMYQSAGLVEQLDFGFDLQHLYLRLHASQPLAGLRLVVSARTGRGSGGEVAVELRDGRIDSDTPGVRGLAGAMVELALPLSALKLRAEDEARLTFRLLREGAELERLPRSEPLAVRVPGREFERRQWFV